jgi:hypothetical protein
MSGRHLPKSIHLFLRMDSLGETEVIYRISDNPQRRNHAAKYMYIHTAESYIRASWPL